MDELIALSMEGLKVRHNLLSHIKKFLIGLSLSNFVSTLFLDLLSNSHLSLLNIDLS